MLRTLKAAAFTSLCLLLYLVPLVPKAQSAVNGSARLYMTPSSGVVAKGNTLAVGIYVDTTGDAVNSVEADIVYPSNLLNYVSITNSTAFPVDAGSIGGNGTVNIGRTTNTPQSGTQLVATVRFTAASDTGTAALTFAKTSKVIRNSDNQPDTLTTLGATYTLTPQPTTAPPPVTPTTGSSVDITPPKITGLHVTNLGLKSATIEWTTNVDATSEVEYGFDKNYIWQEIDNTLTKNHKVQLDPNNLNQGQTYHYVAKSYDSVNNAVASDDSTFTTLSPPPPQQNNNAKYIWIGIVVLLLAGLAAALYYARKNGLLKFSKGKPSQPQTPASSSPPAANQPPSPPTPPTDQQKPPTPQ